MPRNNVEVTASEVHDDIDKMIKRFIKKVKKEGILDEYREHLRYTKPSTIKQQKNKNKKRLSKQICRKCGRQGHDKKSCSYN